MYLLKAPFLTFLHGGFDILIGVKNSFFISFETEIFLMLILSEKKAKSCLSSSLLKLRAFTQRSRKRNLKKIDSSLWIKFNSIALTKYICK
jgi:hypothetical protein